MGFESWRAFYQSDLQSVWSLLPAPALFLVYLLLARRAPGASFEERFLWRWAVLFSIETMLDPLLGGPGMRAVGASPAVVTAVVLVFVLLGDFRVYWLLFAFALSDAGRAAKLAAAATPVVALLAWTSDGLWDRMAPDASGQRLWLIHELLFTGAALWLRARWLPARVQDPARLRFLRRVCSYVILYYALWAACDALWMAIAFDVAWLLRAIPNQLYYAFFVPFVWLAWSGGRSDGTRMTPTSSWM
jgi:hypothetical protein